MTGCVEVEDRSTDWNYLHAAIIEPSCATAGCHSAWTQVFDMDLSTPEHACDALTMQRDVRSMVTLINGEGAGDWPLMPPDGPLPPADIELLERWVTDGASCE
jgi:hypothetical protein